MVCYPSESCLCLTSIARYVIIKLKGGDLMASKLVAATFKVPSGLLARFRNVAKRRGRKQVYYIERAMREVVESDKKSRPSGN